MYLIPIENCRYFFIMGGVYMRRTKKFIWGAAVAALIVSLSGMGVMASSYKTYTYSTRTSENCGTLINDRESERIAAINTRPTTTVDAVVEIRTLSNRTEQTAIFPWQVSVVDWTPTIQGNQVRRIYVKPSIENQRVAGTLYYKWK